jgi:hypothetical protein
MSDERNKHDVGHAPTGRRTAMKAKTDPLLKVVECSRCGQATTEGALQAMEAWHQMQARGGAFGADEGSDDDLGIPHADRYAAPQERTAVGARIDPATAEVWFLYGQVLDPYGDGEIDPESEAYCVGRVWFACDPSEQVAVSFDDLPDATRDALDDKRQTADREGWALIFAASAATEALDGDPA